MHGAATLDQGQGQIAGGLPRDHLVGGRGEGAGVAPRRQRLAPPALQGPGPKTAVQTASTAKVAVPNRIQRRIGSTSPTPTQVIRLAAWRQAPAEDA
jgi:hypothetical protein